MDIRRETFRFLLGIGNGNCRLDLPTCDTSISDMSVYFRTADVNARNFAGSFVFIGIRSV